MSKPTTVFTITFRKRNSDRLIRWVVDSSDEVTTPESAAGRAIDELLLTFHELKANDLDLHSVEELEPRVQQVVNTSTEALNGTDISHLYTMSSRYDAGRYIVAVDKSGNSYRIDVSNLLICLHEWYFPIEKKRVHNHLLQPKLRP